MSAKLQLRDATDREGAAVEEATPAKQSFGDKCVPKLELGNEDAEDAEGVTL